MRVVLLDFAEQAADRLAHGSGPERAAAWNNRRPQGFRVPAGNVLGHENQGPNKPEILLARISDGGQRAYAAGEHGVAQERFAKIVRRVPEGDHIRAQPARDLVDGAAAEPAAQVAAMI